jgi:peptide chain release factor 1
MDPRLAARLAELEAELAEVEERLASGATDQVDYPELGRTHARLAPVIELGAALREAESEAAEARELAASDPSMADDLLALAEGSNTRRVRSSTG